jgi:hypothetical protein
MFDLRHPERSEGSLDLILFYAAHEQLRRSFAAVKITPLLSGRRGRGCWVVSSAIGNHPWPLLAKEGNHFHARSVLLRLLMRG